MADPVRYGSLPFPEAIAYLKAKGPLATERWDDIEGQQHDHSFVVAGAAKADLLADIHAAVRVAIEQGTTIEAFRLAFDATVAKHGWTGWTGADTPDGRAWRTATIYETNLRTAYQAGRRAQHMDERATRPYGQYHHADGVIHPRPLHLSWNGIILPWDDPWVQTHYTPNGWRCRCYWTSLAPRDLAALGKSGPDPTPDDGTWIKPDRHGVPHELPAGIDYGWDHAPGATRDLIAEVRAKAATMPAGIRAGLDGDLARLHLPPHLVQVRQAEAQLIGGAVETTVVWDAAGRELLRKSGDAFSVGFDAAQQALLKDAIVTHTHPVVTSFSPGDINILLDHDAAVVRAVDAVYDYEVQRPAGGWRPGEVGAVRGAIEEAEAALWGDWMDRLLRGQITQAEFDAGLYHAIWERVATSTRLGYERVMR